MILTILSAVAGLLWAALLLLPFRPWSTRERLDASIGSVKVDDDLSDMVAIVPARNEADRIAVTLAALHAQGRDLRVVVVDDGSDDQTSAVVKSLGLKNVSVLRAGSLPPGWTGKVWAQSQAEPLLQRPLVLLLDADIRLYPGLVAALKAKLRKENASLVSLMVELPMNYRWERLLMPAFVFFFKLLYPFGLVNAPRSSVAAAAGGCILMRTRALADIGGFAALKDALIDDCALARLVKREGRAIWIGLTRSAVSTRRYPRLTDIWNMVARTAYTQLGYRLPMLALCTLIMAVAFFIPLAGLFSHNPPSVSLSVLAMVFMALSFIPTLGYYGLNPALGLTLPLSATLFLAMTWTSAFRYWAGERSVWHGRVYRA
ncbi:MAG TPA: glycosyltransferase [Gammaproteobacteria bacterium]|nr:glycosyltransferase [Gammaproteobacteria bacterium]